jgi:uncharacterized membrane protein YfcA
VDTLAATLWPDPIGVLCLAVAISFGAGVVRGFSGFGYSALVVAGLSPFVLPGPLVVAVLMLEVLASASAIRQVWPDVHRPWHTSLLVGNALFVPLGLAGLAWLDPAVARVMLSALVLAGATVVRFTLGQRLAPTAGLRHLAGVGSGLLNGFAASGGIVAALLMTATGLHPRLLRATMISALLWISAYALLWSGVASWAGQSSLLGAQAVGWAVLLWPTMVLGMRAGGRAFSRARADRQALVVLHTLIAVAFCALVTALVRLP